MEEFEAYTVRATGMPDYPLEIISVVTKLTHFLPGDPPKWRTYENTVALCKTASDVEGKLSRLQGLPRYKARAG